MLKALPSGQEANFSIEGPGSADTEHITDEQRRIAELEETVHWLREGWVVPDLAEIDDLGAEVVERVERMRYRIGAHMRAVMTGRVGIQAD